jgi:hypothetical protein
VQLLSSTYLQIADILYISRNTVKTHLRSIYRVASRSQALQRAVDLRLFRIRAPPFLTEKDADHRPVYCRGAVRAAAEPQISLLTGAGSTIAPVSSMTIAPAAARAALDDR